MILVLRNREEIINSEGITANATLSLASFQLSQEDLSSGVLFIS